MSGLVYVPIIRSQQASPISVAEFDSMQHQLVTLFAAVPTGAGSGTVTSVGLALPNIFTITVSPITSTGSLTATLATQSANRVWAGPTSGSAATPAFRSLVVADLPTVTTAKGGTGSTSQTASRLVTTDGSGNIVSTLGVTSTEAGYLSGVTSAIQTQLNAKQSTITVLSIANGGTNANNATSAALNLLPAIATNALKVLRVNSGATGIEWATSTGGIASINSDTTSAQTIQGSSAAITCPTSGGVTTITIASAGVATTGLLTSSAQVFGGQKTFNATPIISSTTSTYIFYAGASKEISYDANFVRNLSDKYVLTEEVIENKITTLTASSALDITQEFIHSEQGAAVTYMLPLLSSVPNGKTYTFVDSLGQCSGAFNITLQAQPSDPLLNQNGHSIVMNTTNFSFITVKKMTNGSGSNFWDVISVYGVILS